MKFYSGFSLDDESYLFDEYINTSDYTVCGFSYGAIKAFEDVKNALTCGRRVDLLQLFSPAFFQSKSVKFKRLQMLAYIKNREIYLKEFMNSCFFPYNKKIVKNRETTADELDELLNYKWNIEELKTLVQKGVKVEVYLGGKDKIIDVVGAREFFLHVGTVTYIKNANHFLSTSP